MGSATVVVVPVAVMVVVMAVVEEAAAGLGLCQPRRLLDRRAPLRREGEVKLSLLEKCVQNWF
jgi:hypothetical protein